MAAIVLNCPHCAAQQMAFSYLTSYELPKFQYKRVVVASCDACFKPVSLMLVNPTGGRWDPERMAGNLLTQENLRVEDSWPKADEIAAPLDVPAQVANSYIEGAEARRRRSWNAACSMYRRTMELSLKQFAPEIEAWKLEKRIDKLANEHKITPEIQTWSHEIRLDGNEALHGEMDADESLCDQMHNLTHFLLVYLYTLPAQISEARARRQ